MGARWRQRILRQVGPFREIARAIWENKDRPRYSWRILTRGVCDGCALGTTGLRDWTIDGIHLCWLRLNLLRLNTMPELEEEALPELAELRRRTEPELRKLGRLSFPMLLEPGARRFERLGWDAALDLVAGRLRAADPRRIAFYMTSRGTVNETYYVAQKVARCLGTNHVDNSARVCHSPSTTGLKQTIGFAATTCSYKDFMAADLVVFLGSDAANNQPVTMKYLHLAKKRGTRIAVVNPYREPGMDRYWVPSNLDSALLGTRICDHFFSIRVGGDVAFLHGALKHLIAHGWQDRGFIENHTAGWRELEQVLAGQSFEELEAASGATRESMLEFARLYAEAGAAIFVWSMGITMHRHGVANVKTIANLALARGMVGRTGAGLMAIRGHSGVQGGAEMGCVPNQFPGGAAVGEESAARLSGEWGFEVPAWKGHFAAETVDAAARGEIDLLYCAGSNLFAILPDSAYVRGALGRIGLRVHHDIVINPQMLVEARDAVLVLPATTRYEMAGGNTETTTERRVVFNPEIPGPRVAEARDEWRVLADLAARVRPERAAALRFGSTAAIREEIARVVPLYDGIQHLRRQGDQFQWGGPHLGADRRFGFADGRARFAPVDLPRRRVPPDRFQLTTRRGKQFNSMILGGRDPLVGATREEVLMAAADMRRLGLAEGDAVAVRSETGEVRGRVRGGPIQPGSLMMYWPEANVLIPRGVVDPECGIPAYRDAVVEVVPA